MKAIYQEHTVRNIGHIPEEHAVRNEDNIHV